MSIKCHEFFGCKREECPFLKYDGKKNCWEVEVSLTPHVPAEEEEKVIFCKNCLYYQHMQKIKE